MEYTHLDPFQPMLVCQCGAVVPADREGDHDEFHDDVSRAALQAHRADAWRRPLAGGGPLTV